MRFNSVLCAHERSREATASIVFFEARLYLPPPANQKDALIRCSILAYYLFSDSWLSVNEGSHFPISRMNDVAASKDCEKEAGQRKEKM